MYIYITSKTWICIPKYSQRLNVQLWFSPFTLSHKSWHSRTSTCMKHILWFKIMITGFKTVFDYSTYETHYPPRSSFIWLVVSLLHGSIFLEKIQSLYFLDDKFSSGHQLLNLFRVCHVFILHESRLQALSEIGWTLGILTAEIQEL